MPSSKVLDAKKQVVSELTERLKSSCAGVFVDYKGIKVSDDTKLRADLRKADVQYAVVKNTLTRFAIEEVGYGELDPILNGTTALATSTSDQVAAAKVLSDFAAKNKNFTIKGGFVDGKVISAEEVMALAKLPNREGLLSMLLSALTGNLRGLAVALDKVAEQKAGPAEEAPAEEAAAEAAPEA